jgi:competence protein ComEC
MLYLFGLSIAILAISWARWYIPEPQLLIGLTGVSGIIAMATYVRQLPASPYLAVLTIGLLMAWRTVSLLPPATFDPQSFSHGVLKVSGQVVNNPTNQGTAMPVVLDHVTISGQNQSWYGHLQVNAPLYSPLGYGDLIKVSGNLKSNLPAQNSYQQYLVNHQIYGTISWPNISVASHGHGNPIVSASLWLQRQCEAAVVRWFPKDESGLLLGIVLGLPQSLSDSFSQSLKATSTTHIIVASGYNASIIVASILAVTAGLKRRYSVTLIIVVLAAYVALSGFNPSMIRAAIMASIAIVAQLAGRQRLALHILALTGVAMLLVNPMWMYDTSWQLSFAATIGIIIIEPVISSIVDKKLSIKSEIVSTTLSAQLATLPIIAATFGTVSLVGMGANLLVLWLVPWIMLIGAVTIPLLVIWPWSGHVLVWLSEPLLWYIKQVIQVFANLPMASVSIQWSLLLCAVYYAALMIIAWRWSVHVAAAQA